MPSVNIDASSDGELVPAVAGVSVIVTAVCLTASATSKVTLKSNTTVKATFSVGTGNSACIAAGPSTSLFACAPGEALNLGTNGATTGFVSYITNGKPS